MSKITVNVVPVSGSSRKIEVDATHSTLGAVLKAAGVSETGQFSINGKPTADMDAAVPSGATVTLTEKARGS